MAFKKLSAIKQFIFYASLLLLSSCLNYSGIHSNAKPIPETETLETSFKPPCSNHHWWEAFHDPKLNAYIQEAFSESPNIQIALNHLDKMNALAEGANSKLWPSLGADASIQRERLTQNTIYIPPFGGQHYTETNLGLNFQYEIDIWGKNRNQLASKISEAKASYFDEKETELMISTLIASTYFELQTDAALEQKARDLQNIQQTLYDLVMERTKKGIDSNIPLQAVRGNLDFAKMHLTQIKEARQIHQSALASLLGRNALEANLSLSPYQSHERSIHLPKTLNINLLASRPEILAFRWRVEAASKQVNVAKSRFYPNVNLLAMLSWQSFDLGKAIYSSSQDNAVGVALDLPLFDANERRSNLEAKYAEYDEALNQYNQSILVAAEDVIDQKNRLLSINSQIEEEKSLLASKRDRARLFQTQYEHGLIDQAQYLDSKSSALEEEEKSLQLQLDRLKISVALIKSLGGNYQGMTG